MTVAVRTKTVIRFAPFILLAGVAMRPSSGWASEDYSSQVANISCTSITREAIGGLAASFYQTGKAFGVPKDLWDDELASVFRARIDACFGSTIPDGDNWSYQQHFDYVWEQLGAELRAKREAATRELEFAKDAERRRVAQEAAAQQAAEVEAARLRQEEAQEAAAQAARQAAEIQAAEQAAREAKQKRELNPSCVEADRLKQALTDRAGGDVANLLGLVVMAHQTGASDRACSLADVLRDDIEELRTASENCDAGEASQLASMGRNLYSMRKEMGCLGWFE